MLKPGHTWTMNHQAGDAHEGSPALATLFHERCIFTGDLGEVYLRREDAIDLETGREFIRWASHATAETRSPLPVMNVEELEHYKQYLAEARAFLLDGHAAGDERRKSTEERGWL